MLQSDRSLTEKLSLGEKTDISLRSERTSPPGMHEPHMDHGALLWYINYFQAVGAPETVQNTCTSSVYVPLNPLVNHHLPLSKITVHVFFGGDIPQF
jgi:hypothetical protein